MKLAFSFITALLAQSSALSINVADRDANESTLLPRLACADPAKAIPLYRAYSAAIYDHLYTTSASEIQSVVNAGTYSNEGIAAKVFATQEPGTVPLYRFYSQALTDHFYTLDRSEGLNAGYAPEGITGYVYPGTDCGGVPFYRLYLPAPKVDHFYTTQASEVTYAETGGYQFEGVAAYVIPA